jgi:hypothetical protein
LPPASDPPPMTTEAITHAGTRQRRRHPAQFPARAARAGPCPRRRPRRQGVVGSADVAGSSGPIRAVVNVYTDERLYVNRERRPRSARACRARSPSIGTTERWGLCMAAIARNARVTLQTGPPAGRAPSVSGSSWRRVKKYDRVDACGAVPTGGASTALRVQRGYTNPGARAPRRPPRPPRRAAPLDQGFNSAQTLLPEIQYTPSASVTTVWVRGAFAAVPGGTSSSTSPPLVATRRNAPSWFSQ